MPVVKCSSCGQDKGRRDSWFQRTRSIEKCQTCKDQASAADHDKAMALKEKELAIEKEKAVSKEKELAIEKEKAASKERELTIEKEKAVALKEKELAIEKEKAATKEKELAIEKAVAELKIKEKMISFEERKYEKDLEHAKWQFEAQKAKDESDHQKNLKLMGERKEELELRISAFTKAKEIDDKSWEVEDHRLKFAQELIQSGQDIDKVQSLLASLVIPSASFQPISASDPKANSDKDSPEAFFDIGNVNENIEDTDCPPKSEQ